MPRVEYSKDQPERFLRSVENSEMKIKEISEKLIFLLNSIGGVNPDLIEEIKRKIWECLETREKSDQEIAAENIRTSYKSLNALHNDYKEKFNKIESSMPDEVEQYCNSFKEKIEWVYDIDKMIEKLDDLIAYWDLKINNDNSGKEITLNLLDYDIKILNLWNYNNNGYNITTKNNEIDSVNNHFEIDRDGMLKISSHCSEWRKVATQTDMQNILRTLTSHYWLKSGVNWDIHDEDIAFFMLMTQSDWEFLLKKDKIFGKDRVLKCYSKFRWFKDILENATGQIILVRKK